MKQTFNEDVWLIGEFREKLIAELSREVDHVSLHINTLDKWFVDLEENKIHYVQRIRDKRVFTIDDLLLAKKIYLARQEKWSVPAIHNFIRDHDEIRAFPNGREFTEDELDLKAMAREEAIKAFNEMKEELIQTLNDKAEQRQQEFIQMTTKYYQTNKLLEQKVEDSEKRLDRSIEIRKEALKEWASLPKEERMKRVGFFSKVEDSEKKEAFIQAYIEKSLLV